MYVCTYVDAQLASSQRPANDQSTPTQLTLVWCPASACERNQYQCSVSAPSQCRITAQSASRRRQVSVQSAPSHYPVIPQSASQRPVIVLSHQTYVCTYVRRQRPVLLTQSAYPHPVVEENQCPANQVVASTSGGGDVALRVARQDGWGNVPPLLGSAQSQIWRR